MPPVFTNIMGPPPPRTNLQRRALSELSAHSNGVDFTSSGQRPLFNNRQNNANVERITQWLSQHAVDGAFLVMDRQEPRSTSEGQDIVMTDGGTFADRGAVVEPEYIFTRPGPPKRKVSSHGHRDQDPGTPEPSRNAMRADMKALIAGKYSMPSPARKKPRISPRSPQNSALHLLRPQAPVIDLDAGVANPNPAAVTAPVTASSPLSASAQSLHNHAQVPTAHLSSRAPARGPPPIVVYTRRPAPGTTPAPAPPPSFGEIQAHPSTPTRTSGPAPILVIRRSRLELSQPVTLVQDPAINPEDPSPAALYCFKTPATTTGSPGDDLESPASLELPQTPTRKRGRKVKRIRSAPKPRPQPKPTQVAVDSGVTVDVENATGGKIRECSFFNIPQEIRNHIYRHLLVSRNPIQVNKLWTEPLRNKAPRRMPRRRGAVPEKLFNEDTDMGIDPRILCVSKQAHLEGSRILYSENRFHYMLRDANTKASRSSGLRTSQINFEKYCHLFRHLSIELEPNRTDPAHKKLLGQSLECLAGADGSLGPFSSRASPPACRISLDTLTLTITPVKEAGRSQKDSLPTVISFFSRNSVALRSLQRINTRSIRFNIHVKRPPEDEESDEESDDDHLGLDGSAIVRSKALDNLRHLETTIDLRFCARFMDQSATRYIENPYFDGSLTGDNSVPKYIKVYPDEFWEADAHILAKRAMAGQRAEDALAELHSRLIEAWKNPDQAVRDGLWEDHEVAKQRRRINKVRNQIRFDCDALLFQKRKKKKKRAKKVNHEKDVAGRHDWRTESDEDNCSTDAETDTDEDTDSEVDESDADSDVSAGGHQLVRTPAKSLIISIAKHGGAFRAFRAN